MDDDRSFFACVGCVVRGTLELVNTRFHLWNVVVVYSALLIDSVPSGHVYSTVYLIHVCSVYNVTLHLRRNRPHQ